MNKLQQMQDLKFKTLILLFLTTTLTLNAQSTRKLKTKLLPVIDVETAKEFVKSNQDLRSKIYVYNEEKHSNNLSKELFKLKEGEFYVVDEKNSQALYKVIHIEHKKHYRANYIYFSGKKMTPEAIKFLRDEITIQVRDGKEFKEFAGKYSMDRSAKQGGDIGWFTEEYMFPEFINALKKRPVNTIYNLDFPELNKYYLVQQTESPKDIKLLTVLKITL